MLFHPRYAVIDRCPQATEKEIKDEPMLFSASFEFAWLEGGPLTRGFLSRLPEYLRTGIIDTRVHMLKPGWYPAIPGWHMDNIPRRGDDGQPNLFEPEVISKHALMVLDHGTGSLTEFIKSPYRVSPDEVNDGKLEGRNVWGVVDAAVNRQVDDEIATVESVESGAIVAFSYGDVHRAVEATGDGWRFFARISVGDFRGPRNEIRNQVQAYLPIGKGW